MDANSLRRGAVVAATASALLVLVSMFAWACADYLDADAGAVSGGGEGGTGTTDGRPTNAESGRPDAGCIGTYAAEVLDAGPLLYLRFQNPAMTGGKAVDLTGNGYSGTYPNAGVEAVPGPLAGESCDTAIHVNDSAVGGIVMPPGLDFADAGAQFSVELWINPDVGADDTQGASFGFVVDHETLPGAPRGGWDVYYGQESVQLELWANGKVFGVANSPTQVVTPGCWHYVVVAYDGTGNRPPTLWLNDQVVFNSDIAGGVLPSTNAGWTIGWQNCGGGGGTCKYTNYEGAIDELAIYAGLINGSVVDEHWNAATSNAAPGHPWLCGDGG